MTNNRDYLFNVKIFYRNGGHKYANIFPREDYDLGIKIGSITGYRKMKWYEKIIFKNCL